LRPLSGGGTGRDEGRRLDSERGHAGIVDVAPSKNEEAAQDIRKAAA
jgi:hypothetical protein